MSKRTKGSRAPLSLDHLDRIDRPTRERIYQRIQEEEAVDRARGLESRGWRAWYSEMFDVPPSPENPEGIPFVSRLAAHHAEAIEWHWNSLMMKRAGLDIIKYIYFAIWSRGHMKSTIARYIAICDAALSGKGYCLYVSGTKGKVRGHAMSIETLLGSTKIREYYPKLSQVMKGEQDQSKGWQANFIYTAAGYVFHFVSLDEGIAGANIDSVRPTLIIPDDVDDRDDSAVISENRLRVLTRAVLPTRQHNTLVLWAQNLISRHSVLYHIYTGKERVLTARVNTEPIPAFVGLVTEQQTIDGIIHDVIIAGTATWPWYDTKRAQEEIDTIGLSAFLAECHPAGTLIRTHRGLLPIEDVGVLDLVTTHRGREKDVTELLRREYTGPLYDIKRSGGNGVLQATATHPFYVARRPPEKWKFYHKSGGKRLEVLKYEWANAETLRVGDYLLEPLPLLLKEAIDDLPIWEFSPALVGRPATGNQKIHATLHLFRLLGYFLAEGSVSGAQVRFDFHVDEKEYIADVQQLLLDVFAYGSTVEPSNGNGVTVKCSSTIAAEFFRWVGTGSHNKRVPNWAFEASNNLLAQLVIGYMRGDGCKDPSGFSFDTVSRQLAEDIRLAMLRLGVVANVYRLAPRMVQLPEGKLYERGEHWMGDINGGFAGLLGEILGEPHVSSERNQAFIHHGYVHYRINEVNSAVVQRFPVYNLEVDEDHSYIAEGVSSHNCQHEVDQDRADAIIPEYNDEVHVITWEEFNAVYNLDASNRDLPSHWRRYVGHDWGSSGPDAGHANVVGWVGVAALNSPLPGTAFLYHTKTFPASTIANTVARAILNYVLWHTQSDPQRYIELSLLDRSTADPGDALASKARERVGKELAELDNIVMWHMSHEAKAVRDIYRMVYGLPFIACVDEGEVLTFNGWVPIQEVEIGDYIYSVDLQGVMSLKRVEAVQHNWYEGDMVRVRSKGLYQSFTPDHQVLFRNDNKGQCKEKWRLLPWNENPSKVVDIIRAPLSYEGEGDWELPFPCVSRTMWLAFLGLWLAEGCVDKVGNSVRITQCNPAKQPLVQGLLEQLPWKFKLYAGGDFVTSDVQLHQYLTRFGKAHQKYVPRDVLTQATAEELATLFRWMMFGDGTGDRAYYTVSLMLANDISEVALKLGWKVYQREQPCHCSPPNSAHRMGYIVNFSKSKFPSTKVSKSETGPKMWRSAFVEPFEGIVHDLTIEDNHTFVLRQRGTIWISGNCNPKRDGGVAQLRHYFRYDMSRPHPFRVGANGLSRMYIIVENEQQRQSPTNDSGMALVREQLPEWRWRPSELTAQGFMDERPMKVNDDVGNMLMMIFTHFRLQATPLSAAEQLTAAIPVQLRYDTLLAASPFERGLTAEQELAHMFALKRARAAVSNEIERFDEHGQLVRN